MGGWRGLRGRRFSRSGVGARNIGVASELCSGMGRVVAELMSVFESRRKIDVMPEQGFDIGVDRILAAVRQ